MTGKRIATASNLNAISLEFSIPHVSEADPQYALPP